MRVCGIDPGKYGAMCVLDSKDPAYIQTFDLDKHSPFEIAKWLHKQHINIVCIEDVHSIFGASAKSNFNFGKNVGLVHAIASIITKGKETLMVTPKVWQKAVGVTVKGSKFIKVQVAELAQAQYPAVNLKGLKGALKDGRSDAIMIAHYTLMKLKGNI